MTPVKEGESRGAFSPRELVNPVLTMDPPIYIPPLKEESEATERPAFNETSPALTIRPVKDGAARGAFSPIELVNPVLTMDPPTNKLLLNDESDATARPAFKETSPALTIRPVKDGAARGAFSPRELVNPVFTIEPPTNKLLLNDESDATERPAFKETSPAETMTPVKEGEARGAFKPRSLVNAVLTMEPFTNRLPLKEASALDTKKVPVKDGDAEGAFNPIEFVIVVENAASFPNAVANSFKVSNVSGALAMSALISERTYCVVAI
jgi:hypothetical protein